jgi:hypothetical protein
MTFCDACIFFFKTTNQNTQNLPSWTGQNLFLGVSPRKTRKGQKPKSVTRQGFHSQEKSLQQKPLSTEKSSLEFFFSRSGLSLVGRRNWFCASCAREENTHTTKRGMKRVAKKSRFLRVACDSFFSFFTASYRACVRFLCLSSGRSHFFSSARVRTTTLLVRRFLIHSFRSSHSIQTFSFFLPFPWLLPEHRELPSLFLFSSPALRATHGPHAFSLPLVLAPLCATNCLFELLPSVILQRFSHNLFRSCVFLFPARRFVL